MLEGEAGTTRHPGGHRLVARGWAGLLSITAVFLALRLPSLLEPPTFNDEGTYADIGWALDHGAVLYRDVWGHYTPGVYWLGALINLVHTSVVAFHLVLAFVVALTTLGVWLICRRFGPPSSAWAAAMAFVVLSSLPTLQGDVLYVEVVAALLIVGAVLLVARPAMNGVRAGATAGGLVAGAILLKVTFAADAIAVATLPLVLALASGRRPGRREARTLLAVAAGALVSLAAAAVALWLGGSLPGLVDVVTHQDEAYFQSASGGGAAGALVHPGSAGSVLLLMTATRVLLVLAVGSVITWRLGRRRRMGAAVAAWWLTWDLAAVMASGLGLAHYAQQMEPALCVCGAMLAASLAGTLAPARPARDVVAAAAAAVIAWAVCVAGLVAPTAEASAVLPQPVLTMASAIVSPHQISHTVGRGWQRLLGLITPASYEDSFGAEPALVRRTVSVIDAHSRPSDAVFVWGRLPWVYALSHRLPAGRYTSLNSSYALDPHARPLLISQLRAHPPAVLVALDPLPPEITDMLRALRYKRVARRAGEEDCWVAPWRS